MDPKYIQTDETKEYYTEERCYIIELLNTAEDRSQSIARARVEPDITTAWHRLKDTIEIYYILEGTGEVNLGEDFTQIVKANDTIVIPAGIAQRIKSIGDEDLVFLCFCTPAFSPECYETLE